MKLIIAGVVIAIIIMIVFVLRSTIYRVFMNLAIGRKSVNIRKKMKKDEESGQKNVSEEEKRELELLEQRKQDEDWLIAQQTEDITITSHDGLHLVGHYLPAENAKRTFLMMHGWRSSCQHDFGPMAKIFHSCGCNILLVEQRAQNKSEGKYMGFGVLERYDCMDWIEFLTKKHGEELPIYLVGVSMGASTVLMASGLGLPKEVKGIIADCGFTSPYEMITRVAKKALNLNRHSVDVVNKICQRKAGYDLKETTTVESLKSCKVPVFFAHGTGDTFVPFEMSIRNYEACRTKKTFFVVDGADHGKSFLNDKERYVKALGEFFGWDGFKMA